MEHEVRNKMRSLADYYMDSVITSHTANSYWNELYSLYRSLFCMAYDPLYLIIKAAEELSSENQDYNRFFSGMNFSCLKRMDLDLYQS